MPLKRSQRDRDADVAALIGVLRADPNKVYECVELRMRTGVPKSVIRGRLTGHANVLITEHPKGKSVSA